MTEEAYDRLNCSRKGCDLCDSCKSYWKAEGEDPPCVEERTQKIARIMAWKYLLGYGVRE